MYNLKFKINNFRKIIIIFVFSFFILHSSFFIPKAFAADSSPSADIKEKLKLLQEEIASRAANIKNEVSKKLLNKAYIGEITTKDTTSLTVNLKSGPGNITINEFTEYIIKSKTYTGDAGLKNLNISDFIAALGDADDKGVVTAKQIVKITKPNPKKIVYGILITVGKDSTTLKTNQNDQFSINFDKNTDYQLNSVDSSFKEIKENRWIIVVGEEIKPVENKASTVSATPAPPPVLLAKFVYIFPSGITPKPKASTPSTTIKP
ncbi:MAG: hypothetical protein WCV81_03975 [Microgenomates group bacterium]